MHFSRYLLPNSILRVFIRQSSTCDKTARVVKVLSSDEESTIKLSLKFHNSAKYNNLIAPKDENVQKVLDRIKKLAVLQQTVSKKYFPAVSETESTLETIDVCLIQNNALLNPDVPNSDAWLKASVLKVGSVEYEVSYNTPKVVVLSLPNNIVCNCPIRPHFIFECATWKDSFFKWYRLLADDVGERLLEEGLRKVRFEEGKYWLEVHEGFTYFSSVEDVGCYLKCVCLPRQGSQEGQEYSTMSETPVQAAYDEYPFDERHKFTQSVCDDDNIRCVSYNILANTYVEKGKFPYSSKKALDIYYRKQLLLREILGYKSDIICLQEVQERLFELDLLPVLRQEGFKGIYKRKGGHRFEGVATFYRTSKFNLRKKYDMVLNKSLKEKSIYSDILKTSSGNNTNISKLCSQDTVLQLLEFEYANDPERQVLVANTHLYSNKDMPEIRLLQAAISACYIEHIINEKGLNDAGLIFCGDFNSLPDSSTYNYITSGEYKNNSSECDIPLQHGLCLKSACGTPEYTNFTRDFQGCLDYIFYSQNSLEVSEIVPLPKHEHIVAQEALPSELLSSDHLALVCTLQWKNSSR